MGTLGTRARNAKKPASRRPGGPKSPQSAIAKLAVALREHKEAVEQQAATANILRALSSTSGDPQPVFEAIVEHAHRLCGADYSVLYRYDGERVCIVANRHIDAKAMKMLSEMYPAVPRRDKFADLAMLEAKVVHSPDVPSDPRFPGNRNPYSDLSRRRAAMAVPLLRGKTVVGAIACGRLEPRAFSNREISLARTFADQAVIAIENARLFNETKEALEHQKASADILRIVAESVDNTDPVFEAITSAGIRLIPGVRVALVLSRDGQLHYVSHSGVSEKRRAEVAKWFPLPLDRNSVVGTAVIDERVMHVPDFAAAAAKFPLSAKTSRVSGAQAMLAVPLLDNRKAIGSIAITRETAGPFTDKQIDLARTFADQAVIAIRNAAMFREIQDRNAELKQALDFQGASGEILASISSSITDANPVFDAIVSNLLRLFGTGFATVTLVRDGQHELAAFQGEPGYEWVATTYPRPLTDSSLAGKAILSGQVVQLAPVLGNPATPPTTIEVARKIGFDSIIAAPMIREGKAIGSITTARREALPFDDKQVALIKAFADQAVIAIENARLFNETKEALEQQTATAQILSVIASSRSDLKPVMAAVVENAARLADANHALIGQAEGENLRWLAAHGCPLPGEPRSITRAVPSGRAMLDLQTTQVEDVAQVDWDPYVERAYRELGVRSIVAAPLVREGRAIGVLLMRRTEVRRFTEKQIALLKTFANQAAIAIENVRLFNETKEALERQTATAEILKVISDSPTDVQPVFDAILQRAAALCNASFGNVFRYDGGMLEMVACNLPPASVEILQRDYPSAPTRGKVSGRVVLDRQVVEVPDVYDDAEYQGAAPKISGHRSLLGVPLLREGQPIGAIVIARHEPGNFTPRQVAMVQTFADQAVIAIENVRLFKELQARTEALTKSVDQLTALGEVGQAISSTLDLETVLKTIVSRAVQLTGLDAGAVYEYDERLEEFHLRAAENMNEETVERLRRNPIRKGDGAVGGTAVAREPIQVPETQDESYKSPLRDLLIRTGRRALLAVPLMRDEHIIGALAVQRNTPGPFAPAVVELLKTFATQSAMAIQNARLFREIAEKGKQLEIASRHKSDFLASMSHELRTPLNALLGFNELILGDVYGEVPPDMKPPLAQMQSSGKHLLRLINNVLDLAKIEAGRMELALSDYSVHDIVESVRSTLRPLAEEKGLEFLADVPADIPLAHGDAGRITQCLMNLAGNSLKFTRAGKVEISVALDDSRLRYCVADTGIGIAPEKIDSLFTEFRQTDATIASEYGGTGLGLSISKKFVELHGGRIWAKSEPGKGSAFTFEVPLRAETP